MTDSDILIPEIRERTLRKRRVVSFMHRSTISAGVMLLAAVAALIVANTSLYDEFLRLWSTPLRISIGNFNFGVSLEGFVNDFLMAIFFLVVGMEVKYEVRVGALRDFRAALLPVLGALGGVLAPILVYTLFNRGGEYAHGWGIPTATDIAFALGILSMLGSRVPSGLKVFLSTLAIADDIVAIIIIAVFYGHTPKVMWCILALAVLFILFCLNKANIFQLRYYLIPGLFLWFFVYQSGIHATIAGVLLALTIPVKSPVEPEAFSRWTRRVIADAHTSFDEMQPVIAQTSFVDVWDDISRLANYLTPPLSTLKKKIEGFSTFVVLPVFAFCNAGVNLHGADPMAMITSPVALGVFFGLLVGKPLGIFSVSWLTIKLKLADLPQGCNWFHMLGAAVLGGVGFTMAIFVANLSFSGDAVVGTAKAAILVGSTVSGILGYLLLHKEAKVLAKREEEQEAADVAKALDTLSRPLDAGEQAGYEPVWDTDWDSHLDHEPESL